MTAFYPAYFADSRPYARAFLREARKLQSPSQKQYEQLAVNLTLEHFRSIGVSTRMTSRFAGELKGVLALGEFRMNEGLTYVVEPILVDELVEMKLGAITMSDLHWPEAPAYFHFGKTGILFGDDIEFEGAYVARGGGTVYHEGAPRSAFGTRITMCGRARESQAPGQEKPHLERYDVPIHSEFYSIPVDDAIFQALARDLQDIEAARGRTDDPVALQTLTEMVERQTEARSAFRKAVHLVLSTLAFMEAEPDDLETRWQDGSPQRLVQQFESATTDRERDKARSKLEGVGYRRVGYIGKGFSRLYDRELSTPGARRAHVRGGHYRRQAWGPQHSRRKIIRIAATTVAGFNRSEAAFSHDPTASS